jgi:hypothetical protein
MSSSKKEHRARRERTEVHSTIGLEPQSLTDVTSYPYPGTLRSQAMPPDSDKHSDVDQSRQQVENWEDEGGTV